MEVAQAKYYWKTGKRAINLTLYKSQKTTDKR